MDEEQAIFYRKINEKLEELEEELLTHYEEQESLDKLILVEGINNRSNYMCRLFGFKSIIKSKVHSSLLHAENALGIQSVDHP